MVIVGTFEVIKDTLFTAKFEGEEEDELQRIFNEWSDPTYLHDFFSNHIEDLQSGFFGEVSIKEAVRITRKEAQRLEKELLRIANQADESTENLSDFFKPLSDHETGKDFEKDKAYGLGHNTWIRLYAIRVNLNVFVICGGAIKLTATMNDRAHLLRELDKLAVAQAYVKSSDQFYELS